MTLLQNVAVLISSSPDVKFLIYGFLVWTHQFNLPPKAAKACFLQTVPHG
jgi:hypothetical protein